MTTFEAPPVRLLDRLHDPGALCLECGQETEDSKPYCSQHVERMPYVAQLLAAMDLPRGETAA